MKLSKLLTRRRHLLEQTQLANLAFAHQQLGRFSDRLARAGIRGELVLTRAPEGPGWPTLRWSAGNDSVLEEHFTDEDVAVLSDVLGLLLPGETGEVRFLVEDLGGVHRRSVRRKLEQAGVEWDSTPAEPDRIGSEAPDDRARADDGG